MYRPSTARSARFFKMREVQHDPLEANCARRLLTAPAPFRAYRAAGYCRTSTAQSRRRQICSVHITINRFNLCNLAVNRFVPRILTVSRSIPRHTRCQPIYLPRILAVSRSIPRILAALNSREIEAGVLAARRDDAELVRPFPNTSSRVGTNSKRIRFPLRLL